MVDESNPFEATTEANLPDFVLDEPPVAEVSPEEPLLPNMPVVEEAAPAPEVAQEAPVGEKPKVWAGKYNSVDELEKGYRELRELQRRTAERANAFEQRGMEYEGRLAQLEDALRRAIPFVEAAQKRQSQPQAPQDPYSLEAPQPQVQQITPEMIMPLVQKQADIIVQQKLQEYRQQEELRMAKEVEFEEAKANFAHFFESHPEVEQGGTLDADIAATIQALNAAWGPQGSELDLTSSTALEIALEATQRPALRAVYEANPAYADSPELRELARNLASQVDGITQPEKAAPVQPLPHTPVVERGSSQAPPPGTPLDEFEEAVLAHRKENRRGSDVFFSG